MGEVTMEISNKKKIYLPDIQMIVYGNSKNHNTKIILESSNNK